MIDLMRLLQVVMRRLPVGHPMCFNINMSIMNHFAVINVQTYPRSNTNNKNVFTLCLSLTTFCTPFSVCIDAYAYAIKYQLPLLYYKRLVKH